MGKLYGITTPQLKCKFAVGYLYLNAFSITLEIVTHEIITYVVERANNFFAVVHPHLLLSHL
jgi:hypothetical protein